MGHAGRTDAQFLFQKWIEALVGKFDGVEDAREEVCVVVVEKQLFSSFKNNKVCANSYKITLKTFG